MKSQHYASVADLLRDLTSLESTTDAAVRNTLALRLAETKHPDVLEVLLKLINKPELSNTRATLVHCLGFYNLSDQLELLINLVANGNWEVAHEAYDLLNSIEELDGDDVTKAFDLLEKMALQSGIDEWRDYLLQDLLAMFD